MTDELGFALLILIPIFLLFPLTYWVHRREKEYQANAKRIYLELAEQDRRAAE